MQKRYDKKFCYRSRLESMIFKKLYYSSRNATKSLCNSKTLQCTKLAENVEGKYNAVIDLLSELNQASLYKQGKTKEANEHANLMKEIHSKEKEERTRRAEEAEERLKE